MKRDERIAVIISVLGILTTIANASAAAMPKHLRADISVGTTGQLFVTWDSVAGATYYNLQRSSASGSGYSFVSQCSGVAANKNTQTSSAARVCRDPGLVVGNDYYYEVQACDASGCSPFSAPVSNTPVASNCTSQQMPDLTGLHAQVGKVQSNLVDPQIQFEPTLDQYYGYVSNGVTHRNQLLVILPGSGGSCGIGNFGSTAQKLGFDVICVNYENAASQDSVCNGDPECFGNISQAKLDATGPCSTPTQPGPNNHCGIDPKTKNPYYLSNPADAVTRRVSMMLQYLNGNGFNAYGTNWGYYLSGSDPDWSKIIFGGHSQGGDMSTFAAYQHKIVRAINLSGPPQATRVNGVETGATYFSEPKATDIRDIFGLVSTNDMLYKEGVFQAVWQVLGFTQANNDAEVKLNTQTPIGLNCNDGIPSHNFSTSAPQSPGGGHNDTLYPWNEDIYKFMLID